MMLDVLIVDDEPFIRGVLIEMIDWEQQGMRICGETFNGEEALRILRERKVDILVTDIKMPVMGGLELIKRVEEKFPEIRIIVLSAYEDYPLVREAFQAGADDYLLKAELTDSGLLDVLRRVREKRNTSTQIDAAFDLRDKSVCLHLAVMTGEMADDARRILFGSEQNRGFRICLAAVRLSAPSEYRDEVHGRIMDLYEETSDTEDGTACIIGREALCLLFKSDDADAAALLARIREFLERFAERLGPYPWIELFMGISPVIPAPESIRSLYNQATAACDYAFLYDNNTIVEYTRIVDRCAVLESERERPRLLRDALNSWDPAVLREATERLKIPAAPYGINQIDKIGDLFDRYRLILGEFASANNLEGLLTDSLNRYDSMLRGAGRLSSLNWWIENAMTAYAGELTDSNLVARRTAALIRSEFRQADTLDELAVKLGISRGYMCRAFREYFGSSIMQYREKIRMEEAVRLLRSTDLRVFEVAEKVGYANVEHFSKVFKKTMGVSPKKFLRGSKSCN